MMINKVLLDSNRHPENLYSTSAFEGLNRHVRVCNSIQMYSTANVPDHLQKLEVCIECHSAMKCSRNM